MSKCPECDKDLRELGKRWYLCGTCDRSFYGIEVKRFDKIRQSAKMRLTKVEIDMIINWWGMVEAEYYVGTEDTSKEEALIEKLLWIQTEATK